MKYEALVKHFERIGARLKLRPLLPARTRAGAQASRFTIDIATDRRGEYFDLAVGERASEFEVLQALPQQRHLLLYSSDGQRFLCGYDERHWFVAQIAGAVSTVTGAKQSLLPPPVVAKIKNLPRGHMEKRRNAIFKRQGEWFFIPAQRAFHNPVIHRTEPLQRTIRHTPHICDELVREGGKVVYLVRDRQYTEEEYKGRKSREPGFDRHGVRTMVRNPEVYVRGCVRHPDHATITLDSWHRVFLNAEVTTSNLTFLD